MANPHAKCEIYRMGIGVGTVGPKGGGRVPGPAQGNHCHSMPGIVADLAALGWLPPGRRLLYYDSQGQLDELLVRDGKFAGFKAGPRAAAG